VATVSNQTPAAATMAKIKTRDIERIGTPRGYG